MRNELDVALEAAREAGNLVLQYYNQSNYEVKNKGVGIGSRGYNPVTTADHASNSLLKEILLTEFPHYGWFSEETSDSPDRLTKERVWIVDPLDGTHEFIEGVPNFVVSIALVENHLPILGVLYNPATEEIFWAASGQGVNLNGEKVQCTLQSELSEMVILNSRTETDRGLWSRYNETFSELRAVGSVGYKLALTAAGMADIFVSLRPKHEWDICGGHCLINEAGGKLIDLKSRVVTYNNENALISPGLIAGNPSAVKNVLDVLGR
ncbi:MAG: 3'(2'),5'-bisphosphate nucleotidase CysQ [Candidatus Neomarinimicrobiota bacterium]